MTIFNMYKQFHKKQEEHKQPIKDEHLQLLAELLAITQNSY